jgi:hypothetical protein
LAFGSKTKTTSIDLRKAWRGWVSKTNRGNDKAMDRKTDEAYAAAEFVINNGKALGKAYSRRVALEHYIKAVKSVMMIASNQPSISGKEMEAQASAEFAKKIEELEFAALQEKTLQTEIKGYELFIEVFRTESANNRTIDRTAQ